MPLPENFQADLMVMSDIHLVSCEDPRGSRLLQVLDSLIHADLKNLVLLGDIFDFCLGSSPYFRRKFAPIGERLERMAKKGVKIYFFEGNHEFNLEQIGWKGVEIVSEGNLTIEVDHRKIHLAHGDLIYSTWHYRWFRAFVKSWPVTTAASLLPGQWMDRFATKSAQISRAQDRYRSIRHQSILKSAGHWLRQSAADHGIFGHFHVPYAEKSPEHQGLLLGLDSWDIPNALVMQNHRFQRIFFLRDGHRVEDAKSFFLERP